MICGEMCTEGGLSGVVWITKVNRLCKSSSNRRRDVPAAPSQAARSYRSSLSKLIIKLHDLVSSVQHSSRGGYLDKVCKASESFVAGANSDRSVANAFFCCPTSMNSRYFCCEIRNFACSAIVPLPDAMALVLPDAMLLLDDVGSEFAGVTSTPSWGRSSTASAHRPPMMAA